MAEKKSASGMLTKGLRLLIALGGCPNGAGVSELARDLSLPVSTTHRLLTGMVPLGFVGVDADTRQYHLGLRVFELGRCVASTRRLPDVALPAMRRVTKATGETTLLGVLAGEEFMYVERVESQRLAQIKGSAGERGPLHVTALGKALMAFLPEEEQDALISSLSLDEAGPHAITDPDRLGEELTNARERGYAVNDEELEEGVYAVGVPVLNGRGRPAASLGIANLAFQNSLKDLEELVPLLQGAADEIAVQLP
jgi:IclR family transcriptional regulator, acetate operon repressor